MAETSYPIAGGGGIVDWTYEKLMAPITGGSVVAPIGAIHQALVYADSTGRQFKVQAGRSAIINGFRWESGTEVLIRSLAANTSGQTRLDLVVIRLDRSNYTLRLAIRQGTPAATPVAPVAVQQEGPEGVWELPIAVVRVVSNVTAGLPSIAPGDVTPTESYFGPPPIVCHSTKRPAPVQGLQISEYDTGRVYTAIGTTWHLIGENGPFVKLSTASGWGTTNVHVQRRNGITYFQAFMYWASSTRSAGTDVPLLTLPELYRPSSGGAAYLVGEHINYHARFYVNDAGVITLINSPAPLASGNYVYIHPTCWPSK